MEDDLLDAPERMSELYRGVIAGDVPAAMDAIQEMSTVSLTDGMKWAIIVIGLLYALSSLIRRVGTAAQPITEAVAEGMRTRRQERSEDDEREHGRGRRDRD